MPRRAPPPPSTDGFDDIPAAFLAHVRELEQSLDDAGAGRYADLDIMKRERSEASKETFTLSLAFYQWKLSVGGRAYARRELARAMQEHTKRTGPTSNDQPASSSQP